ncbi:MAG: hypothetical protein DWQ05_11990 [Calditrichaeota bacterium]|nr:MAG: hypothetical protein DWQ05_11990 [Calditrichota bacterium]
MLIKKKIIAIHGLGNKPSKQVLEDWWMQSIHEGLEHIGKPRKAVPFELVYWADILHPIPLNQATTKRKNDPLYDDEPYIKASYKNSSKKPSLKAKLFNYLDEQLDRVFLKEDMSINHKHITDRIIHRYFSDLEKYYKDDLLSANDPNGGIKIRIQNRLFDVLRKNRRSTILLIAHSMGSIVAFDTLTAFSKLFAIDTFVTIGSPLGLPVIMARYFAEQKQQNPGILRPATPDSIWPKWYNLSDPEDKVAIDHTLNDDFAPNRLGTSAEDISVYNDYENNGERNAHKAYGYLRTPEMAQIIDNFLSRSNTRNIVRRSQCFTKRRLVDLKGLFTKIAKQK